MMAGCFTGTGSGAKKIASTLGLRRDTKPAKVKPEAEQRYARLDEGPKDSVSIRRSNTNSSNSERQGLVQNKESDTKFATQSSVRTHYDKAKEKVRGWFSYSKKDSNYTPVRDKKAEKPPLPEAPAIKAESSPFKPAPERIPTTETKPTLKDAAEASKAEQKTFNEKITRLQALKTELETARANPKEIAKITTLLRTANLINKARADFQKSVSKLPAGKYTTLKADQERTIYTSLLKQWEKDKAKVEPPSYTP